MHTLRTNDLIITIAREPSYTPGSVDNVHSFDKEHRLTDGENGFVATAVRAEGPDGSAHSCIILTAFDSVICDRCALIHGDVLFLGADAYLCSISLPALDLRWKTQVYLVSCYDVYYSAKHDCLITHGELEIARVGLSGNKVWSFPGNDIFSGAFMLSDEIIEVVDSEGQRFAIEIVSGKREEQ